MYPRLQYYYSLIMASERFQRRIECLLDELDEAVSPFEWDSVRRCGQAVSAIDPGNSNGLTLLARVGRGLCSSEPPRMGRPESSTPSLIPVAKTDHHTSFGNGD